MLHGCRPLFPPACSTFNSSAAPVSTPRPSLPPASPPQVWTANVKDLEDTAGSEYFSTLRRCVRAPCAGGNYRATLRALRPRVVGAAGPFAISVAREF